ncbi:hypothetical protein Ais01nite_10090 [Asanoa ishikariensis]|uniref:Sporulation and spore germination n=1 Tax=Asanoa ishikariensis TaxID=137265 RepID=A0A1H3T6J3_9ACTN|nr:hypothetical protein [Asanoa ishikariensis]GIF62974.1 hypothetical protein Ais01nite_10090 [Asanoa ishikariensis]SDZ45508.1 hypothetical protein SAMN05421684_5223 [Asanoa ishikariensis]
MRAPFRTVAIVGFLALLAGCGSDPAPPAGASAGAGASASPAGGTDALGHGPRPTATPTKAPAKSCNGALPADNVWRADVTKLPVHARSTAMVASIGASSAMHPDFGSGDYEGAPIGIPVTTVPAGQKKISVEFEYADESDRGPYPIPANAKVEGGPQADGDRHVIAFDKAACKVYELFSAYPRGSGWKAGSGAVFDLRSNKLRPAGWTSADASGLSIFAGLVRYEEVATGRIDHAIRITVPKTRTGFTWPATHSASSATDANLPQLGQRLRLKSSVGTGSMPKQARIVAEAMKRYGVIVADHGSAWYISGAPDSHWDNDALRALKSLTGSDFEVVDTSSLIASKTSGAVR